MKNIQLLSRVSHQEVLFFTKHLSIMLKSGVVLPEAIDILYQQTTNIAFKKVLFTIGQEIANGQSLKKALSHHPRVFDSLFLNMIGTGEVSGNLEKNLEYLANELQKTYEFNKKVQGAMMYPMFIIATAIVVGTGISIFVLPQLANLFSSMDVTLPLTTRLLLGFSNIMQRYGFIIVPSCIIALVIFIRLIKTPLVKPYWDRFLLRLPLLGTFIQSSQAASFCRNFGLMLKSGLPIMTALKALEEGTQYTVYRQYIHRLGRALEKGKSLENELSGKTYPYLPRIVSKMIGVGEKTGKLDETLLYLGDFFADDVDTTAKNLPTIIEPVLLVVIAGMVLFLALAIISPIYDLTGSIRK